VSPNPLGDRFEHLAQAIAGRVVTLVLDSIDINALIDRVDLNALVKRVDVDAVVEQVDLDAVIDRIDMNAVLARIDMNALVERVDINQIVNELDLDAIVEHTELGSIIAKSTTSILTEILDVIRAQGVGLDDFIARWVNRILRRTPDPSDVGPAALMVRDAATTARLPSPTSAAPVGAPPMERTVARQGQYAGAVSRAAAFAADLGAAWALFTLAVAAISFTAKLVFNHNLKAHPVLAPVVFGVWVFVYFWYQWALSGKTVGMALFGLQVVRVDDGYRPGRRRAAIRTVTYPLAIVTLGIGFLGIVTRTRRQAWYDRFAGTTVVYAWDARAAHLRWLAHSGDTHVGPAGGTTTS
jgi:uncharacterized RDD family membrane protein YckC